MGGIVLGLANVKHIIARHHTELKMESQPGEGTTSWMTFAAIE